jgi:hypothetical protein
MNGDKHHYCLVARFQLHAYTSRPTITAFGHVESALALSSSNLTMAPHPVMGLVFSVFAYVPL